VIRRRDGAVGRVEEGDDVAKFLGITHYNPPEPTQSTANHNYDKGVWPKSLKGWFYFILRKLGWDLNGSTGGDNERAPKSFPPVYDVEGFKNFPHAFGPEDQVVITEKIHGSNARYTFQNKKMYVGSRQLWKSPKSNCVWRKALLQNPWIEDWCRAHPGYTIFGEVFPTQKFKGGATVDYGRKPGEVGFLAFDILTPDGEWTAEGHGITSDKWVPVLYCGPFDEKIARTLAEGKSQVTGANHIREGCVIRGIENKHIRGLGRPMLKIVSNTFLEQS
jgi:RNA ligase (TIGR02306 family)